MNRREYLADVKPWPPRLYRAAARTIIHRLIAENRRLRQQRSRNPRMGPAIIGAAERYYEWRRDLDRIRVRDAQYRRRLERQIEDLERRSGHERDYSL